MANERAAIENKTTKRRKPGGHEAASQRPGTVGPNLRGLTALQQQAGNRAVQRLLAQRQGREPSEIDEETASRINRERSSGLPLDSTLGAQIGGAMGHDMRGVRVHTSPEANALSRQLGAEAFTTGRDVFFREGAYNPHSGEGEKLIAHEMAHVVQQSAGVRGSGSGGMMVNPPGDAYEQEADAVAGAVTHPAPAIQRQELPEEEELEEGEAEQAAREEEEETIQYQTSSEEEEERELP